MQQAIRTQQANVDNSNICIIQIVEYITITTQNNVLSHFRFTWWRAAAMHVYR